jgi:hypothetical protein
MRGLGAPSCGSSERIRPPLVRSASSGVSLSIQASFGEQPLLERDDAGLLRRVRPVNDAVGEVILEIVAKGPHQSALGQVFGDERRRPA